MCNNIQLIIKSEVENDRLLVMSRDCLFEESVIPMCIITSLGCILQINEAFRALLFLNKEDVLGRFIGEVLQPVNIDHFSELFKQNIELSEKKKVKFQATTISEDGDVKWLEIIAKKITADGVMLISVIDVSEYKHQIDSLICEEEKFKQIFEASPDAICITRMSDGVFVNVNKGFIKHSGYDYSEIIGKSSDELKIWVKQEVRDAFIEKLKNESFVDNYEVCFRIKDQSLADAMVSVRMIMIDNQAHLLLFARDIRKSKEVELGYRLLFSNLTSGFALNQIICDEAGFPYDFKFMDVNPAFEKMMGLNAKDIIGKRLSSVASDVNLSMIHVLGQVALTGATTNLDYYSEIRKKQFRVMAFCPKKGFFATIVDDITDKIQQEEELQERDEQLRQMFEHTHSVLMLLNEQALVVRLNRAGFALADRELFDYVNMRPGDLMQCIGSFQNPSGCGEGDICRHCRLRLMLIDTFIKGEGFERVEICLTKNGQGGIQKLYLLVSMSRINMKSGFHVLISIDDITRRKLIEYDLIAAKMKAEESDRLKTAFFSNLSHEIRTPLNGIIGFSNLLKKTNISSSDLLLYTHYINDNSNRLLLIMNNVIELAQLNSKLMKIIKSDLDIDKAVADALKLSRDLFPEKQLNIRVKIVGHSHVVSYPTVFASAIRQLIMNAFKFTLYGSIGIRCSISKRRLSCTVADTGIGIEPSFGNQIFQPFRQEEDGMTRNYGGVGIGLAIVREYMLLVDGSIVFKSIQGRGSVFRIEMPVFQHSNFEIDHDTNNLKSIIHQI